MITKPYKIQICKKYMGALRKSNYVSKHIVLDKYVVGDMRFYRFILLVDNSPNALDWRILPREGRWPDLFLVWDNVDSGYGNWFIIFYEDMSK